MSPGELTARWSSDAAISSAMNLHETLDSRSRELAQAQEAARARGSKRPCAASRRRWPAFPRRFPARTAEVIECLPSAW